LLPKRDEGKREKISKNEGIKSVLREEQMPRRIEGSQSQAIGQTLLEKRVAPKRKVDRFNKGEKKRDWSGIWGLPGV